METYCVSCKKNTADENSTIRKTKWNRLMILSSYAICGKKKSTVIKNKELNNISKVSLKWIKLLPIFYRLETNLCQNLMPF